MTRVDLDPDLDRLGNALRASAAMDLAREEHAGHRRVTARRGVAAGAVALAAAAAGGVVLAQPPSGQSAWARQTLQRAAAVVIPAGSANTILHVTATETFSPVEQRFRRREGVPIVSALFEQAWIQEGKTSAERVIVQVPGGPVLEENYTGQIYNQTTNTVYPAPQFPKGKPHYTLTSIGGGSYRLSVTLPHGGVDTQTLDAGKARALRDGTDVVQWFLLYFDRRTQTTKVEPEVGPSHPRARQPQASQPDPASAGFVAELHGLLDSGHARVIRTTTSDGQPAIEISTLGVQSEPPITYYVNPHTYAPIELDSYTFGNPKYVTRVRFTTYATLPLAGNQQLLRVTVPSTAQVDRTPADYWNAAGLPRPF